MLRHLKISHLAVIDKLEVEFREGFNVLTGETGAGKSIVIGALDLLLGARASADIVRTGEEEAHIEALFDAPDMNTLPKEIDCHLRSGGELVLSRRVLRSGRSRCYINANLATLGMLEAIGRSLVSIFGQHEHHVLLDPNEHLDVLDRFAGLQEYRRLTEEAYVTWTASQGELSRAVTHLEGLERQGRENASAIEELSSAGLRPGEEEDLLEERNLLRNAVQIREKAFEAYQRLYSRSGSLMEGFADVRKAVEYLAAANSKFASLRENLEEVVYRVEDIALELRNVAESFHSDPVRLEKIEDRLALIRRLKKKYGADVQGLIDYLEAASQEVGAILEARSAVRRLKAEGERCRTYYLNCATELSTARRNASKRLEAAMKVELEDLAMREASFNVSFQELEEPHFSPTGLEKVEFYLAANPGEESRPLARVASGGELSRIMLALKALQFDSQGASTLIFDEVDAGIGGHTALAVGTRLSRVARRHQVLCVTHLHQIAALADHHLSVTKVVDHGRTCIKVAALDREQRVEELSRMLGASAESDAVREHVTRLMDHHMAEVTG